MEGRITNFITITLIDVGSNNNMTMASVAIIMMETRVTSGI